MVLVSRVFISGLFLIVQLHVIAAIASGMLPVIVSKAPVKTSIISTVSFETSVEVPKTAMFPSTKTIALKISMMMMRHVKTGEKNNINSN
jgi:hypothetical protein